MPGRPGGGEPGKHWQIQRKEADAKCFGEVTTGGKRAQFTEAAGDGFGHAPDVSRQSGREQGY